MTIPILVLLGFAGWTLLTLFGSVGVYRWSRILSGRAAITEFPADVPHGADWYRRAMRAHANCVENLPVYAAIVIAASAAGVQGAAMDVMAVTLLAARVLQTTTHIAFQPTSVAVSVRFAFFFVQVMCMIGMGVTVAMRA
jgi:uncharacterized MAPEG superfamily protein